MWWATVAAVASVCACVVIVAIMLVLVEWCLYRRDKIASDRSAMSINAPRSTGDDA